MSEQIHPRQRSRVHTFPGPHAMATFLQLFIRCHRAPEAVRPHRVILGTQSFYLPLWSAWVAASKQTFASHKPVGPRIVLE